MALTTSEPLAAGTPLPAFTLPDVVTGRSVSSSGFADAAALVVVILCRHCPYVVHALPEIVRLAADYQPRGVSFLGISANDAETYPDDSPSNLARMVREKKIPFPVLHDETQDVARAFRAVCTPEFFLYGPGMKLFYHGRLDGSTPGNGVPVTGDDLRTALDDLLAGKSSPDTGHPSMGCSIKWKRS
jgi:peroxiredoxin